MARRALSTVLLSGLILFSLIQLVPYRVENPPVRQEPAWDSPQTRELAQRACFDCHSNEVRVPWYGHVAPVAWVVRSHVEEARAELNFSEVDRPQREAHEAGEEVREGEMPPWYYTPMHPEAQLTEAQWSSLAAGLDATLGTEEAGEGRASGRDRLEPSDQRLDDEDSD